jgi:hypothetical protein
MAHDTSRAVPLPTTEPATHDVGLPTPRQSLESSTHDIARPAPERAARDIPRPTRPSAQGSGAGWIVSIVAAAGAAWAVGWVAGVSWAWREMTPRYLRRAHRRRGAGLPGI